MFFRDVELIQKNIHFIIESPHCINGIHEMALSATSEVKEKEMSIKLQEILNESNKQLKKTKCLIELLKKETDEHKKKNELKKSDLRVRVNLCNTLTRKFIEVLKGYQKAQHSYKADIKKKFERQVKIVKPDATEEDIDLIIRSGEGREKYFKKQILSGKMSDDIKSTYIHVAERYKAIVNLEASIAELHQMFLDLAFLTEHQGELLDQIEYNVRNSLDDMRDSNNEIIETIQIQKSIRIKQMKLSLIIISIIIILFLIVFD